MKGERVVMQFTFREEAWKTIEEGEKNCYLLTNGLGGYHSLSVIGAVTRGDQAFFMTAKKAPNVRRHMITNLLETLLIDGKEYVLTSQRMLGQEDLKGYRYLKQFVYENFPIWTYQIEDVTIEKSILMLQDENTVAIHYSVKKESDRSVMLKTEPLLRFTAKNTAFEEETGRRVSFVKMAHLNQQTTVLQEQYGITNGEDMIFLATNGQVCEKEPSVFGPMFFSQDERDGREEQGCVLKNHGITFECGNEESFVCVFSTKSYSYEKELWNTFLEKQKQYWDSLLQKALLKTALGKQLVLSADAYLVNRDSTNGKSIIAGYPFFEDWGRDTMIALPGITLVTGRYAECKSILRTFARYIKNGLLPNLFPEGEENPMYNSADAPLLFINTVYEYLKISQDEAFLQEIYPSLEQIVCAYQSGTDFHIRMDTDGLIQAGEGMEQLTWMDVRIGEHLPTPRHGKPVEINAYWYSALCVMERLAAQYALPKKTSAEYAAFAEKVKISFLEKFWNKEEDCLKDVLSDTYEENQVRCNQIWALTQPFTMLSGEQEEKVLKKVREELYTTIGLRTLSPKDKAFHKIYIGPIEERDRAYHQGTVWSFPLGAYYRACMKYMKVSDSIEKKEEWLQHVASGIKFLEEWLYEGCLAQIAEIYDGEIPTVSRGCFAQAWSVGELLRAVYEWENFA